MNKIKTISIFVILMLLISGISILFSGTNAARNTASVESKEIFMIGDKGLDKDDFDIEIITEYNDALLVKGDKRSVAKISSQYEIDRLKGRNKIYIKDYSFNIRKGPELPEDMKIDGYDSEKEGMYILHMLGPIHPEWREEVESLGAKILNYVPNYAYHIKMTPEEKEKISTLDYVDWIGIYHPAYKLPKDIELGKVRVSSTSSEYLRKTAIKPTIELLSTSSGHNSVMSVNSQSSLKTLAKMKDIVYITDYIEPQLHSEVGSQIIGGGIWIYDSDGDPSTPYREYDDHGALINQLGYDGSGVTVAIADTGLGNGKIGSAGHKDFTGRIVGGKGFGVAEDWADGHGHGTHTAGLMAGDTYDGTAVQYKGFAPYYAAQGLASNSSIYVEKIFTDGGYPTGFDYYEILEHAKKNASAYIHSNSWGASSYGRYHYSDPPYDRAVRDADNTTPGNQPMVIVASAGNNGVEQSTGSPGNAKNVITVGATETYMPDARDYGNLGGDYSNPDIVADFSSQGWTYDNRVKPTVVAPGDGALSTHTPELNQSNLYGLYSKDDRYEWCSGTSQSAPTVSGAAAALVDWYNSTYRVRPSPAMVKALMINTAYDLDEENGNTVPVPNKKEGWGMVNLVPIVKPEVNRELVDQESLLTTGEKDTYSFQYDNGSEPLEITLTWTDQEAAVGDNVTLKNNLDLKVIGPDGELVYRGNAFDKDNDSISDSGYTYPNTDTMWSFDGDDDGYDDRNVVENVKIPSSKLKGGVYQVKVIGENIPADSNNDGKANQDYALVMSNIDSVDSNGTVRFDNTTAALEDTLDITVTDSNLSGSVNVTVASDSETSGEEIKLTETDIQGEFTGSIEVSATDSPGVLQVSNNETVEVKYYDKDNGDGRSIYKKDTLKIDGTPPEMMKLDTAAKIGLKISWYTDEKSTSILNYGYDKTMSKTRSIDELRTHHVYNLDYIRPGKKLYYEIKITDQVGNSILYDNGGEPYNVTIGYSDDVESGNVGFRSSEHWQIWDETSYEGSRSWNIGQGDYEADLDSKLRTVTLNTSDIEGPAILSWWHKYDFHLIEHFEEDYDNEYVDGGVVEVYDGGKFWTRMYPETGYDEKLAYVGQHSLSEQKAFAGQSDGWEFQWVNVSKYVDDSEITIRFRMASSYMAENPYVADYRGWNLDNIYFGPMPDYKVFTTPQKTEKIGDQGMDITHEVKVMNMGGKADTYDFNLGGARWQTDVLNQTGQKIDSISLDPNTTKVAKVRVHIPQEADMGAYDLSTLTVGSQNSTVNYSTEIRTQAHESILLVDDDGGHRAKLTEDYFAPALDAIDRDYDMYTVPKVNSMNQHEGPSYERMKWYQVVIWNTGDARDPTNYPWTLSAEDEENISKYLEDGGRLWFTSKHHLFARGYNSTFDENYLKISSYNTYQGVETLTGVQNDPITAGIENMSLYGGIYADQVKAGPEGRIIFRDEEGKGAAVRTDDENLPYKTVFFPFWFEGIYFQNSQNGEKLADRVLDWLEKPMVQFTTPGHNQYDVSVGQDVKVEFSQSMNSSIVPNIKVESGTDPGGWNFVGWQTTDYENDTAVWTHNDWNRDEKITVNVTGFEDVEGRTGSPYHFSFGTEESVEPEVVDNTEDKPTTGDSFTIKATIEDNMKISEAYVEYSTDVSGIKNVTLKRVSGSSFRGSVTIPSSAKEFTYQLSAVDPSENWNATDKKTLTVADNDSPSITDKTIGSPKTGEAYTLKASVVDNRGEVDDVIAYYYLEYADGTTVSKTKNMILSDGLYQTEISIPKDSTIFKYSFETIDSNGNKGATKERKLFVLDVLSPTADTGQDITAGIGEEFVLDASGSSDNIEISSYEWSLDNNTFTGPTLSYSFAEHGRYTAELTVTDSSGNTDTDTKVITVEDQEAPVAEAGQNVTIDMGESLVFNGSRSHDNIGIASYEWTIEGSTYTGMTIEHTFDEAGEYNVKLEVTDVNGNTDTDSIKVFVRDTKKPEADAGESRTVPVKEKVILEADDSSDNVGISNYTWEIDGEKLHGDKISYVFDSLGEYEVILKVKDEAGNSDVDEIYIDVIDDKKPIAIAGENRTVEWSEKLTFNASKSTDNVEISSYHWKINGEKIQGRTVDYTFDEIGEYQVKLIVEDTSGNTAEDKITITVKDSTKPIAEAGANITVMAGEKFTLNASDSYDDYGMSQFRWEINGDILEGKIIQSSIEDGGLYEAELTVKDHSGNKAVDTIKISVKTEMSVGPIKDEDGNLLKGALVKLKRNDEIIEEKTTGKTGEVVFTVIPGEDTSYSTVIEYKDTSKQVEFEGRSTGAIKIETNEKTESASWFLIASVIGLAIAAIIIWQVYRTN